jgi:hypothetical protein
MTTLFFDKIYDEGRVTWIKLEVRHTDLRYIGVVHIFILNNCSHGNIILTIQKVSTFETLKLSKELLDFAKLQLAREIQDLEFIAHTTTVFVRIISDQILPKFIGK